MTSRPRCAMSASSTRTTSRPTCCPAATTVDLFAQVPLIDKLSFVARAENLFDAKVITRNQAGSEDLGTRRLWAGFRYGFSRALSRCAAHNGRGAFGERGRRGGPCLVQVE